MIDISINFFNGELKLGELITLQLKYVGMELQNLATIHAKTLNKYPRRTLCVISISLAHLNAEIWNEI